MNIRKLILALLFSMFVLPGVVQAEAGKWDIDTAHSAVYFEIRHIYSTVRGLFSDFSGTVRFDPENITAGSVSFEVNVDSINTNITKRDNHLRSGDFFNAGKFEKMTFKSTHIRHITANQYEMEGNLTIRDVTRNVTVPFVFLGMQENKLRKGSFVAGFETAFSINRLDYGVGSGKYYDMGVIGKDVRILVTMEVMRNK